MATEPILQNYQETNIPKVPPPTLSRAIDKASLKVKIYRSITEVDESGWDAIVGEDRIFSRHRYVEALEKSSVNEGKCYYPVVYDGDEIVAHTCIYFLITETDVFARGAIKKIILLIRRIWKDFFILKSLESGPPIALGSSFSFKTGLDRAALLKILCREIENLAKELKVKFILLRDFYDNESYFYDILNTMGYSKIHNLPKAEITIRWKSFKEYLDSMRSSYRCRIVKRLETFNKAGVSIKVLKDFTGNTEVLKKLYDNVYDKAKEVKRERLPAAFFHNFEKYLGEKAVMHTVVKDGRIIGYMLSLVDDRTFISMFPGLDYKCNQEYCIYYSLFYETIKTAIEAGMQKIDMGITTLEPKKDMGSDIVNLNMYMKHFNPILNKIIPFLYEMITPPDTTGQRNVFK